MCLIQSICKVIFHMATTPFCMTSLRSSLAVKGTLTTVKQNTFLRLGIY